MQTSWLDGHVWDCRAAHLSGAVCPVAAQDEVGEQKQPHSEGNFLMKLPKQTSRLQPSCVLLYLRSEQVQFWNLVSILSERSQRW